MPRTLSEAEITEFRESLCAAASKLFAERGTDGVTMRALAEVMGISPMKPYHYFRDKEDILAAAMTRAFNRFLAAIERADSIEGTPQERATAKRYAYVQFALAEPDNYRIMFELPHPDPAKHPLLQTAMDRARTVMHSSLDELVALGVVAGDARTLGYVFWCAIHGAVSVYIAGKLDSVEQLHEIVDIAMKSLLVGLRPQSF